MKVVDLYLAPEDLFRLGNAVRDIILFVLCRTCLLMNLKAFYLNWR